MWVAQHYRVGGRFRIPAPLAAVLSGVLFHFLFSQFVPALALKPSQMVNIPKNIFAEISFPDFSQLFSNARVWKDGIVIGLLATIETLLCIEAVDKLDKYKRITPVNRELVAQGVGNITCGMLGAIPITAVVVRGAANVDAGGKTRLSAITHGVFLILTVTLIPFVLNQIPYPSLAAILLVTGYNLAKPALFKEVWKQKWKQFIPFITTIIFILVIDLLIGVTVGLLTAIYFIIQNNFKEEFHYSTEKKEGIDHIIVKLNSNVTFLNKVEMKKILEDIPENSLVTIDAADSFFIDYDVMEVIDEFKIKAADRKIKLTLINMEEVECD